MTIKPKRGTSFFLKSVTKNTYAFGICLSSKSDEDDEYKIIRTEFSKSPTEALKMPLVHTDMFDFHDTELYEVVEWSKQIVKALSRKQLFGKEIEVRLLHYNSEVSNTPSNTDVTAVEDDFLEDSDFADIEALK